MPSSIKRKSAKGTTGKLRIGDDWNAINIIALSQTNPLKAVAELIENSIDAHSTRIKIVRGRQRGQSYLKIVDDGDGIPLGNDELPDFKYVATHICDSIKRQVKAQGEQGIQGEFGIGLLSFWTVGETLSLVSAGNDGKMYQMEMAKGDPTYSVTRLRRLVPEPGVELTISPLLPGIRHFSGEKLQWYLASELRDRIRRSGVEIVIIDRQARAEYKVEPREFSGRLLHHLTVPSTPFGDVYAELYLADLDPTNCVGLYRSGTRVVENLSGIEELQGTAWTSGYIQGLIDAPFLNLTPGTRLGLIRDERFIALVESLSVLETALDEVVREQKQAADEQANRDTLKSIQRAFREALMALPEEEYDWFDVYGVDRRRPKRPTSRRSGVPLAEGGKSPAADESGEQGEKSTQKEFFEHAGPLHNVRISPATTVVSVGKTKSLRAVSRDRAGRDVDVDLTFDWKITEGEAELEGDGSEIAKITAPEEPQLVKLTVRVMQGDRQAEAEALVTVTDSLLPDRPKSDSQRGLPEYTFEKRPGELWRSRYDLEQNVIVVNNGHRDFVYAARNKSLKLRYVCRLFSKELVCHNFPGHSADQLLERMIELSLYTEENLR